jgi:dephospho-CoA kinase
VHLFGLTGGIASGKSAVGALLRARGVPVIDADQLAREAVVPGSAALADIVREFGEEMLLPDGTLDRKKLARAMFADDAVLKRVNGIVHPRVTALTLANAARLRDAGEPLACYEAALIVENGVADAFRPLVVVAAPEEVQVARASTRDGASVDDVRSRIRAQFPLADKVALADYVIENTGTLADLERKTDETLAAICARLGVDASRYGKATSGKLGPG